MIDYNTPFGSFLGLYLCFTTFSIVFIGGIGLLSPNINKNFSARFRKMDSDLFGQVFWRLLKALSILAGVLSLLGAAINLEKFSDDLYKPQTQKLLDYKLAEFRGELNVVFEASCRKGASSEPWCGERANLENMLSNSILGARLNEMSIRNRLVGAASEGEIEKFVEIARQINGHITTLKDKSTVDPYFKLVSGVVACIALAVALAFSFGEAMYQFRLEWDKDRNNKKKMSSPSKNDAMRSHALQIDDMKSPSFEPPYHA